MKAQNYFVETYRRLLSLSPAIKQVFITIGLATFVFELVKILPPFLFKIIIDTLVSWRPGMELSATLIAALLGGYLGSLLVMSFVESWNWKRLASAITNAEVDLSQRTLRKLLALDLSYHEKNETGRSMNKMLKGQVKVNELLWEFSSQLVPVLFQSAFTAAVLFWLGFELGVAFAFFLPMFFIITKRGALETQKHREAYYRHHDEFASLATQAVMNVRTVKDFANEDYEMAKSKSTLAKFTKAFAMRMKLGIRNFITIEVLTGTARVVTLGLAVWLFVQGRITAGSLVLALTLSEKAFLNLARLYRSYYRVQDAEPSIAQLAAIKDAGIVLQDSATAKRRIAQGRIELSGVTFSYTGGGNAIERVSFDVPARSTVALVGRSGAGKSTLVKLLFRHMDPQSGTIAVDGVDLREYRVRDLRAALAVVSQDVELFSASVAENIAYGRRASRADIVKAAKLAHAHGFVERLPNGYETRVGERGVLLSGGQKQRIAIARALLRKPKILIFDEATSSLDAESEREIHESIVNLMGKLTLVVIAHRFSTIEHADKIVLLENGSVEEVGTHAELVQKSGIFAKLRRLQKLGDVK